MSQSDRPPAVRELRRRRTASSKAIGFLNEKAAVEAVQQYLRMHPKTLRLTVTADGEKVVVHPAGSAGAMKKKRKLALPPPGYFAKYYTPVDAAEDNAVAGASALFDPADLPE